jgi:hypothetical protein
MSSMPEISLEAVVEKLRKRLDEAIWTISVQEVQIEALQALIDKSNTAASDKELPKMPLNGDRPT